MITINTTPPACGQTLDCLSIDIETDNYVTGSCGDSFIALTLKSVPADASSFGLSLTQDGLTLFDTVITFKNTPIKRTHSKIEATVQASGEKLLQVLNELDEIMEYCEVSSSYDSGANRFLITIFKKCTIATFAYDSLISTTILDKAITTASTELEFEPDFKVSAKVIECPYNSTEAYKTLVDDIDVYFDKLQEASVYLANRIKPFLATPFPSLTTLVGVYENWQKKIKVVFTEIIDGVAEDAKATGEFIVLNAENSALSCSDTYNKYEVTLCRDQPGFVWFYVKQGDGSANQVVGYDEEDNELFTETLDQEESGLYSFNVSYGYLFPNGLIPSGTVTLRLEITNNNADPPFDVLVSYTCENCEDMESFLFLTDCGVFESIQLRLQDNKFKVKKELYTAASACADEKKAFSVDIENTFSLVTPRIDYMEKDIWKEFLSSKEIYWLTGGELVRVTDEGGSVGFKKSSLTEINVEFNANT